MLLPVTCRLESEGSLPPCHFERVIQNPDSERSEEEGEESYSAQDKLREESKPFASFRVTEGGSISPQRHSFIFLANSKGIDFI